MGVVCLCCGVVCGSGSESEDDDEEESEEEEEVSSGVPRAGCSPSGSSRARVCGSGLWTLDVAGPLSGRWLSSDSSIGGGSSTCIWVAVLSSATVGIAPKSTYLDPVMLL